MFSRLGPLFRTTFRQAESNDTRQHIPHEERDQGRRKRDEERKPDIDSDPWVDNTSVGVPALRTFLIDFLKTSFDGENVALPEEDSAKKPLAARPPEKSRPTSTKNARAVRAYQSMAEKSQNQPPLAQETQIRKERDVDLLESKELRDIYQLIDDLDFLAAKGVTTLNIMKADSFIESLKNAVYLAKSKL